MITPKPRERKMIKNEDGEEFPEEIDEEEERIRMKPQFQKDIYPDSVILIRGSD